MIEPTSDPVTARWDEYDDPNQQTIALLQEEVARLEAELRARDEAPPPPQPPAQERHDDDAPARGRVDELLDELAGRDETIEVLLEQSRLFEEAAEAQKAEWEQLHHWVDEVERRVESRNSDGPRLRAELEAERVRAESIRRTAEADHRDGEARRAGLESEVQHLRGQLARVPEGPGARDETGFIEVVEENRQLRVACEGYRQAAAESEELGRRLAAAMVEVEQARRELRHLADEGQRQGNEREAEIGSLRSQLARESLLRKTDSEAPKPVEPARPSATDADERIRAFRQHLKELHEKEAAERSDRSLSSRLSRLWRHTGPG